MTEADQVRRLAHRWTMAITDSSYIPKPVSEVEAILADGIHSLLTALDTPSVPSEPALELGRTLVTWHFTNVSALGPSLRILAADLPPLRGEDRRDDVIKLLGALAGGFADELRNRTLDEQELIRHSALRARDAAEEARRASEARFRAVFDSSAIGIAIADLDGTILDSNQALVEITGLSLQDLIGRSVFLLSVDAGTRDLRLHEEELSVGHLDRFRVQCEFTGADDQTVVTELAVSLVRDAAGIPDYQVVLVHDVTHRHMLQQEMHRQATHDPLTGLANRALFQSKLQHALVPAVPGRRVGLCFFDLDGFKAINDSLGHSVGDALLRSVGQRLQAIAVTEDSLAVRMGGDEFVVLTPDSQGTAEIIELVEALLAEIAKPVRIGPYELSAEASVGVVERPVIETTESELLQDADITLYRAKSEGRAQWVLFDPQRNFAARERFKRSAELPAALAQNQLYVEYRPVRVIDGGALPAVAATVRWDYESEELNEAEFLGLAEETGLISRLGNWVLKRVCEHAAQWAERFAAAAPIAVVELTPRQLNDPEFVGDLQRILRDTGMPPGGLCLDLPESVLLRQQEDPLDTLEIIAEMGVLLGVHDFGTHYMSLPKLHALPLSGARISGPYLDSFANPHGPDPMDEHLVGSLVSAGKLLGLAVTADGVRTTEQAQRLRTLGVRMAGGEYAGGVFSALEIQQVIERGPRPLG